MYVQRESYKYPMEGGGGGDGGHGHEGGRDEQRGKGLRGVGVGEGVEKGEVGPLSPINSGIHRWNQQSRTKQILCRHGKDISALQGGEN